MFNFDTKFTKGKNTFEIVNNEIVREEDKWFEISAVAGNALIRHWLDKVIIPQVNKYIPSTNFDTLVGSFTSKIQESLFSPAQNLVLRELAGRSTTVSTCEIQELYNPVTDDDSKLKKWWKELNAFNYKKYSVSKDSIINSGSNSDSYDSYYGSSAKSSYNKITVRIEAFRALVADAGDDLINWSDHKISRRSTHKAWELSDYTEKYCEHLAKKGIKKEDKKKSNSKQKLMDIVDNGDPTQDDYFRYYKQACDSDASIVIPKLDLEQLYKIIESKLKCVTSKLGDGQSYHSGDYVSVARYLGEKSVTKQDYQKIIKWATPKNVSEEFMIKHKDHTSVTKVIEYCESSGISTSMIIDEGFYQTCLAKIPSKVKYKLNTGLTYQYMVRMNDSEKIKMLKELGKRGNTYSIEDDTLHGLYADVDYTLIKDTILDSHSFIDSMCGIVINNNDHDSMVVCAKTRGHSLETQHKVAMFDKLTFDEKKQVIVGNKSGNDFTGGIKTLNDTECLNLLAVLTKSKIGVESYITAIFKQLTKQALPQANKIVATIADPNYMPLDEIVIEKLTVATKIVFLNNGIRLKDTSKYYSYGNKSDITSLGLGINFFSDLKRQDIDKVYPNPISCEYRKFLAHTMTKDELEQCVDAEINYWSKSTHHIDLQESFLRHNLDLLSYGYVKQFKEKESFRIVVGDRRDRTNKAFGEKLLDKMNVSQSIDFMFS